MIEINDKVVNLGMFSDVCNKCKHYKPGSSNEGKGILGTCKAFPKGIPDDIWIGKNNHKKPYKGDHGIQFEKV